MISQGSQEFEYAGMPNIRRTREEIMPIVTVGREQDELTDAARSPEGFEPFPGQLRPKVQVVFRIDP